MKKENKKSLKKIKEANTVLNMEQMRCPHCGESLSLNIHFVVGKGERNEINT